MDYAFEILIAIGLVVGLGLAMEIGFRIGRHAATRNDALSGGQIGALQGATLGLLGLLLGFSFAGAAGRFLERQDLVVSEANAIGTAYLRADLLDEPLRSQLRTHLAGYVHHRLRTSAALAKGLAPDALAAVLKEVAAYHDNIWATARDGVIAKPDAMVVVIPPVNELIDLHATRIAASRKHLPPLVMGLLLMCSVLSMAVIGYGSGVSGRRHVVMAGSLGLLVAAALWTTIDLDQTRRGLIRLSDAPLAELNLPAPN